MLLGHEFHCISCGKAWGSGEDVGSSGICPDCFSSWVNGKKKLKGLIECYGKFDIHFGVNCNKCTVAKLCFKDTYGIE